MVSFLLLLSSLYLGSTVALAPTLRPPKAGRNILRRVQKAPDNLKSVYENWKIEISDARFPDDLEQIKACRMQAFVDDSGEEVDRLLEAQEKFVNAEGARTGKSTCLVAKERIPPFRILGTVDLQQKGDGSILLQNVFVSPEARGRGLARRLIEEAERVATESSNRIFLTVDTNNRPAVNLYQNYAYETEGVHSLVHGISMVTGVNLRVDMRKDLP